MILSEKDKGRIVEIKKATRELYRLKNNSPNDINKRKTIDLYHKWRTESEMLFEKYFSEDNRWMKKFNSYTTEGNGYVLIDDCFTPQLPIHNALLEQLEENLVDTKPKQSKYQDIFISHSIKDKDIIQAFVDLILDTGLLIEATNIFCTSLDGKKIESGEEWRNYIKERLENAKVTILIITPNYKESEVCLNEMGASWVSGGKVLPLFLEPINYETVGVIVNVKQVEKLLDEKALDRLKDILQKLGVAPKEIPSDGWTTKKTEFILKVQNTLETKPFRPPLNREEFDRLNDGNKNLKLTVNSLSEEKENLNKLVHNLEKVKDKPEVVKIKKDFGLLPEIDEFENLRIKVNNTLQDFSPILIGIFFKEFSGKNITIRTQYYEEEIDLAIAEDIIDEELNPLWDFGDKTPVILVKNVLDELDGFMSPTLSEDFFDTYSEKYDAPFDLKNLNFWKEVLDVKVIFN